MIIHTNLTIPAHTILFNLTLNIVSNLILTNHKPNNRIILTHTDNQNIHAHTVFIEIHFQTNTTTRIDSISLDEIGNLMLSISYTEVDTAQ